MSVWQDLIFEHFELGLLVVRLVALQQAGTVVLENVLLGEHIRVRLNLGDVNRAWIHYEICL